VHHRLISTPSRTAEGSPQSAGSVPPRLLGKGGENPTVPMPTWCWVTSTDYFLGGRMKLEKSLRKRPSKRRSPIPGHERRGRGHGHQRDHRPEMENYCRSLISTRGYAWRTTCCSPSAAPGRTHAAGYNQRTQVQGVIVTPGLLDPAPVCLGVLVARSRLRRRTTPPDNLRPPGSMSLHGRRGDQDSAPRCSVSYGAGWERSPRKQMAAAAQPAKKWSFEQLAFTASGPA